MTFKKMKNLLKNNNVKQVIKELQDDLSEKYKCSKKGDLKKLHWYWGLLYRPDQNGVNHKTYEIDLFDQSHRFCDWPFFLDIASTIGLNIP